MRRRRRRRTRRRHGGYSTDTREAGARRGWTRFASSGATPRRVGRLTFRYAPRLRDVERPKPISARRGDVSARTQERRRRAERSLEDERSPGPTTRSSMPNNIQGNSSLEPQLGKPGLVRGVATAVRKLDLPGIGLRGVSKRKRCVNALEPGGKQNYAA